MNPTREDFLEALPFPALLVSARGALRYANLAAQSLSARLHPLTETLRDAMHQAATHGRTSHFTAAELPLALVGIRRLWVRPFAGLALLLADSGAEPAVDYTTISSTMAAMLAHEVRNPLLSIKGAAQLLKTTASHDDAPLAELIIGEVARMNQLIATLDPLATATPPSGDPVNVHELLEQAWRATCAAVPQRVQVEKDYDPSLPEIAAQRDGLMQALVNLMKNACEAAGLVAMPRVTLQSRYVLADTRRNAQGQRLPVAISIADNGRGVPPAFMPQLFAPFATTKTAGRGLGLAIVARIVEAHGGLILHDAPPQGGARFTLYLPIAGENVTKMPKN